MADYPCDVHGEKISALEKGQERIDNRLWGLMVLALVQLATVVGGFILLANGRGG